jgi:hypothetical protein
MTSMAGPCGDLTLPSPQIIGCPAGQHTEDLVCVSQKLVINSWPGGCMRKAEEEVARSANGDDENAARRRGRGDMHRFCGEGH